MTGRARARDGRRGTLAPQTRPHLVTAHAAASFPSRPGSRSERIGERVLPRPSPRTLARHDDTTDEQLASPDAPRLTPFEGTGQAALPDRAVPAERLGLLDIGRRFGEEQLRIRQAARKFDAGRVRVGTAIRSPPAYNMSANFLLRGVRPRADPVTGPGNTKAVSPGGWDSRPWRRSVSGYTGGLQGGGPTRVENLVSVTSYPPKPAIRPSCVLLVSP